MHTFEEIWDIAVKRKGTVAEVEKQLQKPKSPKEIEETPDDRYLALMTRCIFQAGFNWKVIEAMWQGFEEAFDGFDIARCAMLHDEDFERLVSNKAIVRHGPKIKTVQENARFIGEIADEHGSFGKFLAAWPADDYIGLLELLKKKGARLGGNTGQYFLRFSGVESFILSQSTVNRLIAEGVVDKQPSAKKDMVAVQAAFNEWRKQSGRSLTEISRVLAMSID